VLSPPTFSTEEPTARGGRLESSEPPRRMAVRRLVITAKEHARLAARNPAKRPEKDEMVLWLTTWLENPPVFREWVSLRKEIAGRA